jgi:hypothetical protein
MENYARSLGSKYPPQNTQTPFTLSIKCHQMSRQAPFKALFVARLILVLLLGVASREADSEGRVKITEHKARDIKSGETVLDRSTRFIIKEVA